MDKDLPDFLSDAPQAAPEAAQEPAMQAEGSPSEAIQAPPEVNPAPAPAPTPEATPADPQQPAFVPIAALLDERDKRQAADARAQRLEQWRQQEEEKARRQPPPDRYADPEAYEAHRDQQIEAVLYNQNLRMSERLAVMEHGQEVVAAVKAWYDTASAQDPHFDQKVRGSPDPYAVVIAEWKRQQFLNKVDPGEYEAFLTWKAGQAAGQAPAAPAQPAAGAPHAPPAAPAPPRASIAGAPAAGRVAAPVPRDGADTFSAMFEK